MNETEIIIETTEEEQILFEEYAKRHNTTVEDAMKKALLKEMEKDNK